MKVEILTLCDAATVDGAGKLNILGSFDRLNAPAEPIVHPQCALAVKLRFEHIEEGPKKIRVTFVNADGAAVMPPIDGTAEIRILGRPESSVHHVRLMWLKAAAKISNSRRSWKATSARKDARPRSRLELPALHDLLSQSLESTAASRVSNPMSPVSSATSSPTTRIIVVRPPCSPGKSATHSPRRRCSACGNGAYA